jgi:uncharacterized protein
MQRRSFFGGVFAGLSLSTTAARAATVKPGDIPKRVFGKTGEKLTVIGQAGGRFPLCSFEEAAAIVRRAYDLGINYFDNAHSYWNGRSEEVFGAVLPAFRKQVFITTKSTKRDKGEAMSELELSLKRMKTDYVDLWQVHAIGEMAEIDKLFGPGGAIESFEQAKKQGKARFIGFTGHHDPHVHAEMLKRYDKWDTILMPLHAADPAYLSFEKIVLPKAVEMNLGIQAMKITANAKLLSVLSVRDCIRYALSLPAHCAAIGCTTIGQLEDDVRVVQQFKPLAAAEMAELRKRAERVKGPWLEDWKRNVQQARDTRPVYTGA